MRTLNEVQIGGFSLRAGFAGDANGNRHAASRSSLVTLDAVVNVGFVKILKPLLILLLLLVSPKNQGTADEVLDRKPHLIIDVSAAMVNGAVQRSVDRIEPVEEEIRETPVHGTGRTVGTVRAELVPDARSAAVEVIFQGCVWSRTVGTRHTVR